MNRELESLRRIHQTATSCSAFFKQDVVFEMNVLVQVRLKSTEVSVQGLVRFAGAFRRSEISAKLPDGH